MFEYHTFFYVISVFLRFFGRGGTRGGREEGTLVKTEEETAKSFLELYSVRRESCEEYSSVADPDPYVFGPPGPDHDPLVRGTNPDLSIIKQK